MKLETVIGLEIHVQLNTKSKMFCACPNISGEGEPNSAICPICMGYPGTLPVPNKKAIEWIQLAGAAMNCDLAPESKFDRKSYFYPDLPKGYQISQYDQPFCGKGWIQVEMDGEERKIGITRIHLEEDAAKNTHPKGVPYTLVDYNRAGTPLIEIVTEPDIRSPQEARVFLQELQRLVRMIGISNADMEKGQLRCDANISLRKPEENIFHPKTEIKNVNSFRFVEKALEYEIQRQKELWEKGETPSHATRGYDSDKGVTVAQRAKEEAADYRYFPEPDIPPFLFTEQELDTVRKSLPELPWEARYRFEHEYGLTPDQAQSLVLQPHLAHFFEDVVSEIRQLDKERVEIASKERGQLVSMAVKIILREVRDVMHDQSLLYADLKITAENFAELITLVHHDKVSTNVVRQVLDEMQKTGGDPDPIIEKRGLAQVSQESQLEAYVDDVIQENPEVVERIRGGKESAIQFLMGQVMAKTRGAAKPQVVIELLKKRIGV